MCVDICQGKYAFAGAEWEEAGFKCKQLISGLLQVSPAERMTVEQALCHPWFSCAEHPAPAEAKEKKGLDASVSINQDRSRELDDLVGWDASISNLDDLVDKCDAMSLEENGAQKSGQHLRFDNE